MLTLTDLICCSIHQKSAYVLSCDKEQIKFPSLNLDSVIIDETTSIDSIIKDIFTKHLNIDFNWARPKIIDIDIYSGSDSLIQTHIYYGCYIPYRTTLNESYWVLADEIITRSNLLRKVLCLN